MQDKFQTMAEYISAGFALTPLNGKIPQVRNWQNMPYEITIEEKDFPENFGVVLKHDDLVIDCDPRNYPVGRDPLKELCVKIDLPLLEHTFTVQTGAGGYHVYLKKPKDFPVKVHSAEFPGLEFKTYGAQVVGAGCVHPDTKKLYTYFYANPKTISPAPTYLLMQVMSTSPPVEVPEMKPVTEDTKQALDRFVDYLKTVAQPAYEGQHGDFTTYLVALKGRDLGLSAQKVYELMASHYNPRCVPPWPLTELRIKVKNAYRYNKMPEGTSAPEADFTPVSKDKSYFSGMERGENGQFKKTLANAIRFFNHENSPFYNLVCWNEFTEKINIIGKLPWYDNRPVDAGMDWTDSDAILCKAHLSLNHKFEIPVPLIYEAIHAVAFRNKNNPVKNYLEKLEWDGKKRLESWLTKYCGAAYTPYTQMVGEKTLVGAVARIYDPGCKFDFMLVLEGPQGVGKSRTVKVLGGAWYGDLSLIPHEKDTIAIMRGKWIVEASEMAFQSRSEADQMKAFISRQEDVARLSYERTEKAFPRKCIFIGTINPDSESGYLKDQTGNRRFWPVEVRQFDVDGLQKVRDQLFAEAIVRYKGGEKLYLHEKSVEDEARGIQEDKRAKDQRAEVVETWLDQDEFGTKRDCVKSMEIWTKCFNGSPMGFDKRVQREIGHLMQTELGWKNTTIYDPVADKVVRVYLRPGTRYAEGQIKEDMFT